MTYQEDDDTEDQTKMTNKDFFAMIVGGAIVGAVALIAACMWAFPHYSVWQQGLAGEAELKRAEQNKRIAVQEAQAKLDSSKLLAESEVERAKGIAQANKIIAEGLGGPEGYLRWLWIDALNNPSKGSQIIYIPTEAGLPVLEAGKR